MKHWLSRLAVLALTVALSIAFVGCGGSSAVEESVEQAPAELYRLEINSARTDRDHEGNDVIIVTYILTNLSDHKGGNFIHKTDHAAYQNGTKLEEAHLLEDLTYNLAEDKVKVIAIGETAVVEVAYKLISDANVDVEFSSATGGQQLTKQFLLAHD